MARSGALRTALGGDPSDDVRAASAGACPVMPRLRLGLDLGRPEGAAEQDPEAGGADRVARLGLALAEQRLALHAASPDPVSPAYSIRAAVARRIRRMAWNWPCPMNGLVPRSSSMRPRSS